MVFLLLKSFVYELIDAKKQKKEITLKKRSKVLFSKKENIFIQDVTLEANFLKKKNKVSLP